MEHSVKTRPSSREQQCYGRGAAVMHLILLTCLIPLTLSYMLLKTIQSVFSPSLSEKELEFIEKIQATSAEIKDDQQPCILIVGAKYGKTLSIMRALKTANPKCRIVLTDTAKFTINAGRFSKYCYRFEVLNANPSTDPASYAIQLANIAKKYRVTGFLPVSQPNASKEDSRSMELMIHEAQSENGRIFDRAFHVPSRLCEILDDKFLFCKLCSEDLGLSSPRVELLSSERDLVELNEELIAKNAQNPHTQVEELIIKNLSYDDLHRLDMFTLPTSPEVLKQYLEKLKVDGNLMTDTQPWVAQTKMTGKEYSAAVVIRSGKIALLSVSPSSASQLDFQNIQHEEIESWVRAFVSQMTSSERIKQLGGIYNCQLCLDFMELQTGGTTKILPIECNTRIHSQLTMFEKTKTSRALLGAILLGGDDLTKVRENLEGYSNLWRPTFHLANDLFKLGFLSLFGLKNNYGSIQLSQFLHKVFSRTWFDGDFDVDDMLPFFMKLHVQLPMLLVKNIRSGKPWIKLDFCIGKVVELNGYDQQV